MNKMCNIKDVKLIQGMSKIEVNQEISNGLLLEDEVFLGGEYKHNWKCKCGRSFKRVWKDIKKEKRIYCIGSKCYLDVLNQKGKNIKNITLIPKMKKDDVNFVLDDQAVLSFKGEIPILNVVGWGCKPI